MEVGQITQTVEVRGVAPILQTEATQTGGLISGEDASSLPLAGRNFTSLTLLMPGSVTPSGTSGRPYTNGNREQSKTFLLDGVDINETIDNGIAFNPNVDAIAEISVATGNAAAEFGNANGSVVNMSLKSGTNKFHGNAFDYCATTNSTPMASSATVRAAQESPCGAIFSAAHSADRSAKIGSSSSWITKAAACRAVEHDRQPGSRGRRGPETFPSFPSRSGTHSLGGPAPLRTGPACFPGNIIPQNRIVNPAALELFANPALYPLPNTTGTGTVGLTNNYVTSTKSYSSRDQADAKIDARLTSKDNISARYTIVNNARARPRSPCRLRLRSISSLYTESAVLNWVRTISPSMVNEVRRASRVRTPAARPSTWRECWGMDGNAKLGIAGGQPDRGHELHQPGRRHLRQWAAAPTTATPRMKISQYGDNLTFHHGRHNFKMGGQVLRYDQNRFYGGNNGVLGFFTYNGTLHRRLLRRLPAEPTLQSKGRGSLAGTLGPPPVARRHSSSRTTSKCAPQPHAQPGPALGVRRSPIVRGGRPPVEHRPQHRRAAPAGKNGNSRALYNPYYKQFEPRVGIAWTPGSFNNKLVVRGGLRHHQLSWKGPAPICGCRSIRRSSSNPTSTTSQRRRATSGMGFTDVVPPGNTLAGQVRVTGIPICGPPSSNSGTSPWSISSCPRFRSLRPMWAEGHAPGRSPGVQPAAARRGPVATWAPLRAAPARIQGAAAGHQHQRHGFQRDHELQLAAGQRPQALQPRPRVSGLLHLQQDAHRQPAATTATAASSGEGAYWQNAYDRRGDYGPAFFNATHVFTSGGHYDLAGRQGPRPGRPLEPRDRLVPGGWGTDYIFHAHSGFPVTLQATGTAGGQNARSALRPNRYSPDSLMQTRASITGSGRRTPFVRPE